MFTFFGRKKVYKILLVTSLVLLCIGYINLNGPVSRQSTQLTGVDEWSILDGWIAPSELDGNKNTCGKLLRRMENNSTLEMTTLGIGGILRLVDSGFSASDYLNEMRRNLTALKDLFKCCDIVHALSSVAGADKMGFEDIISFLSISEFELMKEVGVSSLSLAVPELRAEGLQQGIPQIMRAARSSGIHLSGVVSQEGAVPGGREQAQSLRLLDISKGKRVGVLSYCAVPGCEEKSKPLPYRPALYVPVSPYDIQLLRAKGASLALVTVNWGLSSHGSCQQYKEVVNRQLALSGADVIVGQLPNGEHSHALYGTTLVINSAGVMFGRNVASYLDTHHMDVFLFYRVHYGRLGGMKFEYMLIDRKNPHDRREWTEVCSSQDVYCMECVQLGRQN